MFNFSTYLEISSESHTGLIWKPRDRHEFRSQRSFARFNNNLAGKPAGSLSTDQNGYQAWKLELWAKSFVNARIIYEILNGSIPEGMTVDHKNGNSLDNNPENIRLATKRQNKFNEKLRSDSLSGFKGVSQRGMKWMARIGPGGKDRLGTFNTPEEAHAAYAKAAQLNYLEFARMS